MKKKVLFLCTGNSCRSQMAEGWLRNLAGDRFNVASAGTHPVGLNPYAVKVMGEAGVDISNHVSERIDPYLNQQFHYVITVCDHAQETCPVFPGAATKLHWSFDDPAKATGNRGGSGNSDSVRSGSLASPKPPSGGQQKERGDETYETESRNHL